MDVRKKKSRLASRWPLRAAPDRGGIVSYRCIAALTQTSYLVTHTHLVLEHLTTAVSLLKDAETGQRGFVITGDDAYLEPYQHALTGIPTTLKRAPRAHQ